ncbi:hypothetical protein L523_1159 [Bordetella bronchiseptica MBORD731]|nr:hypothetical protein L523_1159 [Bordetella bronchiseptica MBORD731]
MLAHVRRPCQAPTPGLAVSRHRQTIRRYPAQQHDSHPLDLYFNNGNAALPPADAHPC